VLNYYAMRSCLLKKMVENSFQKLWIEFWSSNAQNSINGQVLTGNISEDGVDNAAVIRLRKGKSLSQNLNMLSNNKRRFLSLNTRKRKKSFTNKLNKQQWKISIWRIKLGIISKSIMKQTKSIKQLRLWTNKLANLLRTKYKSIWLRGRRRGRTISKHNLILVLFLNLILPMISSFKCLKSYYFQIQFFSCISKQWRNLC